jgi:alkylhydroperoxidase/carboxymuconolactone decarboxylase family protein YurZ
MTTSNLAPEDALSGLAHEHAPVLEAILQMHLDTLADSTLDEQTFHLVRLAALIAVGAPPVSYLVHLRAADEAGISIEQAQGVMTAIAPIVGTARVTAAAGNVLRGLGLADILADLDA